MAIISSFANSPGISPVMSTEFITSRNTFEGNSIYANRVTEKSDTLCTSYNIHAWLSLRGTACCRRPSDKHVPSATEYVLASAFMEHFRVNAQTPLPWQSAGFHGRLRWQLTSSLISASVKRNTVGFRRCPAFLYMNLKGSYVIRARRWIRPGLCDGDAWNGAAAFRTAARQRK